MVIGGDDFAGPVVYDDLQYDDVAVMGACPWFNRVAVEADDVNDFDTLDEYAVDGYFYWGVPTDALRSRSWKAFFAVADTDLKGAGTPGERWVRFMKDCLLYTSPSPRDQRGSRMPSSA